MGHFSPSGIGSRKHRHLRHHLLLGLLQVLPQEFHLIINADGERSLLSPQQQTGEHGQSIGCCATTRFGLQLR